jgi:hypothetical protein
LAVHRGRALAARGADLSPHYFVAGNLPCTLSHRTPSTCAQTATVAKKSPNDAKAIASSTTDRTMLLPYRLTLLDGTKSEHSSLIVLESRGGLTLSIPLWSLLK